MNINSVLAALPAINDILRNPSFRKSCKALAEEYRTPVVREVIARHREILLKGKIDALSPEKVAADVIGDCVRAAETYAHPFPRRVINGTGVLIHTNLGRAPLAGILDDLQLETLSGYSDLEWNSETQARGDRDAPIRRQLRLLTGAEAALVVNNCASAVYLALSTMAAGKDVLVSRSELVEIGGSFRVPDIMSASGCRLVEVGTTNKTRISDFEQKVQTGESVLLRVHQSNFVQRGFVEQVPIQDLVELGRRLGVPVIEDNGSGLCFSSNHPTLAEEPQVIPSIAKGVDVLCCSADKLLGGVQAGILLGRAEHISRMRKNPLFRVLRLDKVRLALLSRTLALYLSGGAKEVPLWQAFHASLEELAEKAAQLSISTESSRWKVCRQVPLRAKLGGGTNPEEDFESLGLEFVHRDLSAQQVKRRLAMRSIPVAGYVQNDRFYLDMRTIFPRDLQLLQEAFDALGA